MSFKGRGSPAEKVKTQRIKVIQHTKGDRGKVVRKLNSWGTIIVYVDPQKKVSLNVNSEKKLICWDGFPMVKEGLKFDK